MARTDSGSRPNIVFIQTDQQRWDTLGTYGNPMGLTPTLDAMAEEGTTLRRAFTAQPLCGPARAILQTGQYATRHGIYTDASPLPKDARTLAHEFGDAGYETGFVGDWHLAATFDEPVPVGRRGGYDDYWVGADVPEFTTRPKEGVLYDRDGNPVEFSNYRTDAFTDFVIKALEVLNEPFFLVVSYLEPHDQNDLGAFIAPDGYADRNRRNPYIPPDLRGRPGEWYRELPDYYGIIQRIDECVSRITKVLNRRNDDTIICFTSDHGCHFRTRPGEFKRSCHEASIRVPALLTGPRFDTGSVINEPVSLIDLPPTLLDAAGLDVPERMDGRSILSLLRGKSKDWPEETFVQISEAEIGRAIRTKRWKYAVAAPATNGWRGGMSEQRSEAYVERYLYDLASDPAERVNLVGRGDYRSVADDLRSRLRARIVEAGEPEPELHPFENPGYRKF